VIWLTDHKLHSRRGTTNIVSRVMEVVRAMEPFPVIGEISSLTVDMTCWDDERRFCNLLESLIIWSDAPVSIIQVLSIVIAKRTLALSILPWLS